MQEHSKRALLFALGGVLAMLTVFRGCGGYGEVGPSAYEHAKALYSICNRQDTARLETFSRSLASAVTAGEVSEKEQIYLADILALAEAGDWQEATASARRLMEDQIEGGP